MGVRQSYPPRDGIGYDNDRPRDFIQIYTGGVIFVEARQDQETHVCPHPTNPLLRPLLPDPKPEKGEKKSKVLAVQACTSGDEK